MPVWRFKDPTAAEQALWVPPGDPSLTATWISLIRLSAYFGAPCPPRRGVRKFATMAEANADDEAWIDRRIAASQLRKRQAPQAGNSGPVREA